jgi:ABC-2 type transport system permease protein
MAERFARSRARPGQALTAVARKEFRQIVRDRRTLLILLFVPAFFLLLYGYALNFDIRHVRLAVDDRDKSAASRSLVAAFVNSGYFDLVTNVDAVFDGDDRGPARSPSQPPTATHLMDRNAVRLVVLIPPGFSRALQTGEVAPVQVLLNGDNANTATTVMGYALTIIRNESAQHAPGGPRPAPMLSVEPRVWYNPELRSALFLVPGLIAYIAMITAVVSTALSIVREKERGTIEQIRMSPLGAATFVVGKTVPYFVVSLASALGIVLTAMVLFGLPMRGSWLELLLALSLFLVGALGLGVLISSMADTQQVAFQAALLASFLPTLMLSGFIFPIASMPRFLQVVTYVVPARYFLVALRSIVLKGAGLQVYWTALVALAAFAAAVLGIASARLQRQWR